MRKAKDYLDYTAFSRSGLINQLVEFDGFSTADATFAVDHITVDWNEQAAKAAKDYLDVSGFSRSGLIDQLEYFRIHPNAGVVWSSRRRALVRPSPSAGCGSRIPIPRCRRGIGGRPSRRHRCRTF